MGYESATGAARLYTINLSKAVATPIGSSNMMFDSGETYFGFDFNPTVDRIRVVTSSDNNYRLHPVTGTIAATDLNISYLPADPNTGADASAIACAYTNSYIAATATALYVIDGNSGNFTLQNPPNNGSLNTISNLGPIALQMAPDVVDMDGYYNPMTMMNTMYLIGYNGTSQGVYSINTTNGTTTMIGSTGGMISDFAVQISVNTPPTMNGNYAVIVTSASGCTDTSDCMMVSSLAISDLDAISIELYPNPTNGKLNIQVQDSETHTVSVMDAMGRVVLPAFDMTSNTSIHLSTMNNGVYFVKIDQLVKQVVKR